jgi:arylsulfatase A-like enzyme
MKNVILITLDATRKDVFGLYGNTRGLTPFIDSLSEKSAVYSNCQSAGPYTQSSFPAILCSGYYLDYGKPSGLAPERTLVSEVLQKYGVVTAAFHSNPYCSSLQGWERGWDEFYDGLDDELEDERLSYVRGHTINARVTEWLGSHVKTGDRSPFFAWVHYMDVHEPYMPEKKYVDLADPSIGIDQDEMYTLFEDTLLKRDVSDPAKVTLLKRLYDVHVREADSYVESLFRSLGELGVLQDTAVIITSDHGDEFNEHGGLSHDDKLYAELIDVPMVIYGAGGHGMFTDVVSSVDIPPTILRLFGIEPPASFAGQPLLPSAEYTRKCAFGEAINQKSVKGGDISRDVYFCRMGDIKLIYRADRQETELYDLKDDPLERNNLAASYRDIGRLQGELKPRIRRWQGQDGGDIFSTDGKKPARVAVLGFDCAMPHLVEKHIAEGHLPNFKKLIEAGVMAANCLPVYPTITPPNWASIATGAWPGTHGITDFWVPVEGTSPDNSSTVEAFSSQRWQAEPVWDAMDRVGKTCIVVNYPGSWPSNMKNGIMVGGAGLTIGEFRDGLPGLASRHLLCNAQLITTGVYPKAIKGKFGPAGDWQGLEDDGSEPLEMTFELAFPEPVEKVTALSWHILIQEGEDGYDRVTLAPSKNMTGAFFTIRAGEWSRKCYATVKMADGSSREVFFRCKLLELSEDCQDFRLYISAFCQAGGWASPPGICAEIESSEGIFGHEGGLIGYSEGWFDLDTYVEINELHDAWLGDVVTTLLQKHKWDLLYLHSHPIDWAYHVLMDNLDEATSESKEHFRKAWEVHLKIYQSQDRMLGRIVEVAGGDTLFVLVSDHGAGKGGATFNPYQPLVAAGLTVPQAEDGGSPAQGRIVPDVSRSKVLAQRMCHIYINLRGRDPQGIVEPSDYAAVQRKVIDALYRWTDPDTGNRPVSLALTKNDARVIGLHGDRIGDVIYALYTDAGNQHGQQLSASESAVGNLRSLLVMSGPGVKKGYRLQRTCWLTDIVPTICSLCGWPVPAEAEGSVIYQALAGHVNRQASEKSAGAAAAAPGVPEGRPGQPGDRPDSKGGEKGRQPGATGGEMGKKNKANERLKKLGYDLPY